MELFTNLYNAIIAFIENLLSFFGLNTEKVPDQITTQPEETTGE